MLLADGLDFCTTREKRRRVWGMRRYGPSVHCGRGREPTTSVGMGIVPFGLEMILYI